jgi:hypothetical protein
MVSASEMPVGMLPELGSDAYRVQADDVVVPVRSR